MRAYLDHAATAPMSERVRSAYLQALTDVGNPASTHAHGQRASARLERARERIADAIGCDPAELTLTSGGTESINLALKGLYWARRRRGAGPVILLAEGEHHASIEAAEWLRDAQGAELELLPIEPDGTLSPETLRSAIARIGRERIAWVSFLWANNEVGGISPVRELAGVAAAAGVPVHVDAVAAFGQVPVSFRSSGATVLSVSAHKLGGPGSIGGLAIRRDAALEALLHGGSQQRARSGSQDVAAAVGFAAAVEETFGTGSASPRDSERAVTPDPERIARMRTLRDRLVGDVRERIPDAVLRGPDPEDPTAAPRLPGNAHFTFPECQGDSLVFLLDAAGVSASVGSACRAGVAEVSHVLLAMGVPEHEAAGSLRFTLGPDTADSEIDALIAALPDAVHRAKRAGLSSSAPRTGRTLS